MGEPTPRTADQLFGSILSRLTGLERRMGKTVLPERLGPLAPEPTDANEAVETADYLLRVGSLNSPDPTRNWILRAVGTEGGGVYQEALLIQANLYTRERWARNGSPGTTGVWNPWKLIDRPTTTFSPSFNTGVVVGNGTFAGTYEVMGGYLRGRAMFTFGSTSTMLNSDIIFDYPLPVSTNFGVTNFDGAGRLVQASGGHDAAVIMNSTGIYVRAKRIGTAGDFVSQHTVTSTTPEAWAAGNRIEIAFGYPIA